MKDKKITVITTVYNKAKYLETWAESLSKQTYLDKTNILVIDDGSTDDSLNLLKRYSKKYNLKINLQRNSKNMGLLYTIRKAYRQLDTKYFAVLDADDYYISPQKIEKAVTFLESHDDYSAYACNYLLAYSESVGNPALPSNVPNQTFTEMKSTPFFQTSSMTFRNFFTPQLLARIDYFTDEKNFGICENDTFRNAIALGFGKFYFENSIDAVWRCNIGDWGTLSKLEQDFLNMCWHKELFEFYKTQFNIDTNAEYIILSTAQFYIQSLSVVSELMKNLSFFKIEFKPYFIKTLIKYPGLNDTEKILGCLLNYGKFLSDIGVVINL